MWGSIAGAVVGGLMSRNSGGGRAPSSAPWGPQRSHLTGIWNQAQDLSQRGMTPWQGAWSPTLDPWWNQSQAGGDPTQAGNPFQQNAAFAQNLMSGQYMTPEQLSPFADQAVQAAVRPLEQQFRQQVVPGIGSAAQEQGAYGGSRHGIALGQASEGLARATGDVSGSMYNQMWMENQRHRQQDLDRMMQAPGMLSDAARQQLAYDQMGLEGQMAQWQANQEAPWQSLERYAQLVGAPITAQSGGSAPSQWMQGALGGAMLGNQLYGMWNTPTQPTTQGTAGQNALAGGPAINQTMNYARLYGGM